MTAPGQPLRLAVDASSAQKGGGLTYLRQLLPRLASRDDIDLTAILVRETSLSEDWCNLSREVFPANGRAATLTPAWLRTVRRTADVVYAPTEIALAPSSVPLVLALRSPLYSPLVRGEFPFPYRLQAALMLPLARLSSLRATRYIAVSKFAADIGIRNLKLQPNRISVIYHGAPAQSSSPRGNRPTSRTVGGRRLLYVSNASVPYKNLHRLLQALGGVSGQWTLDVVGHIESGYRDRTEQLALGHGIRDRIRFHGHCERDTLNQLYHEAEWFIWPSYGETFGHPLLEAHSAGLKLLVASAASNPEIIGEAAWYFSPFDIGQMRDVIQAALDGGHCGVGELPRNYSWYRCAEETAKVLHSASGSNA